VIKLIGIDVDGTLLDSRGRVPAANVEALHAASRAGIQLVIATGRSFYFALPAVSALPEPLTLIVHNGAIARTRAGVTLVRQLLSRDVARAVLSDTGAWRDCAALLFDRPLARQMISDRMDWTHPNRRRFRDRNRDIIEEIADLEDALTEDPIQVAFNGGVTAMREVVAALAAHLSAPVVSVSLTEYEQRDFSLVDVCAAGTSKGQTLARLAALLGIAREEVMAIGDNLNDRDMLEWAGTGVVMGNASDEMKSLGLHVTGSNDESGLARAVRKFAL
jgi:Cof subfamily protein (haloacid dehalogenase superfamily)